jgi:hypothetical protein
MKYVKLTVKDPSPWFKPGTQVYDYNSDYSSKKHITLEDWEKYDMGWGICVRGMLPNGEIDGELCSKDEFEVEIIEL